MAFIIPLSVHLLLGPGDICHRSSMPQRRPAGSPLVYTRSGSNEFRDGGSSAILTHIFGMAIVAISE